MLSHFDRLPECDGRTDGQADRQNCYTISRVSVLTRDKNKTAPFCVRGVVYAVRLLIIGIYVTRKLLYAYTRVHKPDVGDGL